MNNKLCTSPLIFLLLFYFLILNNNKLTLPAIYCGFFCSFLVFSYFIGLFVSILHGAEVKLVCSGSYILSCTSYFVMCSYGLFVIWQYLINHKSLCYLLFVGLPLLHHSSCLGSD